MLDALAAVLGQVLLDLALVVLALVDRDADLAARRGHRLREQPGLLALDVEVADLAEAEQPLVEPRPDAHVAALDVVGQVIDDLEAGAGGVRAARAGHEVDVVDRVLAVAVDEVHEAAADALDARDVELHGPAVAGPGRAPLERAAVGEGRVAHPERHRAGRWPVRARELLAEPAGSALMMKLMSPWR